MMYFDWNPAKSAWIWRHRKIDFATALHIFHDPLVFRFPHPHGDEVQWRAIGRMQDNAGNPLFLTVPHEVEQKGADEYIWIITAWKSTAAEIDRYYKENGLAQE
ncbi:MAG: BrnT family toxin [Terriglobales bacterium]|jgi:uncharacterized DUF497 family protein